MILQAIYGTLSLDTGLISLGFLDLAQRRNQRARIYFNNHARTKSVRNAFLLMDMLLIEHTKKEIQQHEQFAFGEFQSKS